MVSETPADTLHRLAPPPEGEGAAVFTASPATTGTECGDDVRVVPLALPASPWTPSSTHQRQGIGQHAAGSRRADVSGPMSPPKLRKVSRSGSGWLSCRDVSAALYTGTHGSDR